MNVLCLFQKFDLESSTIYLDLVQALAEKDHRVMVLALTSDRDKAGKKVEEGNITVSYEYIPDQFQANKIKKGLIQLMIGNRILKGVKRNFWSEKVDIIIYPTPPVTLSGILRPLKDHYGAVRYLMLKDIFPQNAVDLRMMREGGLLYSLFKRMERKLYRESDRIGCMSRGNMEYIRRKEPDVDTSKLELFPNTVKVLEDPPLNPDEGSGSRPVRFIFGGNLGAPQAIDFLIRGISEISEPKKAEFIFIGSGTEEARIRRFIEEKKPGNLKLLRELPRREYEKLLRDADVGIVSLNPGFTIPNYPSRILSYMQLSKPVFAVTDRVTDVRDLVEDEAKCGWWCPSDDITAFTDTVNKIISERQLFSEYGKNGKRYLTENFNVENSVSILENAVREAG